MLICNSELKVSELRTISNYTLKAFSSFTVWAEWKGGKACAAGLGQLDWTSKSNIISAQTNMI